MRCNIDWKKEGHGSAKLEYLALEKGWFYDAHRAEMEWLRAAVYGGRAARVQVEKTDANVKYSSRAGVLANREI